MTAVGPPRDDLFYSIIRTIGSVPFRVSGRPLILGQEHTRRLGPFILAANHQSPYDVPLLMVHARRHIDFVSIVEVFQNPLVGWFYGSMNAFPLDRGRADPKTVRIILDRLQRGRVVGMFPEGGFRTGSTSVVHTRRIKPGIGRIARLAGVPIVPVAIVGSPRYSRPTAWLPLRNTRYGLAFGEPIASADDSSNVEARLCDALSFLHSQLVGRLGFGVASDV